MSREIFAATGRIHYRAGMATIAEPGWLLLAPLTLAAAGLVARRRPPALRYPSLALVHGLPRGRARRATVGPVILTTVAALLLIVAAAGPRRPDLATRVPAVGVSIVLVLDVSGSMATPDYPLDGRSDATRLDAARLAFRQFVEGGPGFGGRPDDAIGLVTFAAVPRTVCPLTLNHSVLLKLLDAERPRGGPDAGTNVGDALAEAVTRLDGDDGRRKLVVLLSDGEHNASTEGALKPRQAAQLAKSLGFPVYAIDCGGDADGATADERDQRDAGRESLAAVARMTGGQSFAANNAAELRAACKEIDALERQPLDTFRYRRYHNYGRRFALAAVGLLALNAVLTRTRWRVAPL